MSLTMKAELKTGFKQFSGTLAMKSGLFTPPDNSLVVIHIGIVNGPNTSPADVRDGMQLSGGGLKWKKYGGNGATTSGYTSDHTIWVGYVKKSRAIEVTYSHDGTPSTSNGCQIMYQIHSFRGTKGKPKVVNLASGAHDQGDAAATINFPRAAKGSSYVSASRYYNSNGNDGYADDHSLFLPT